MKRRTTLTIALLLMGTFSHAEKRASLQAKPSLCIVDRRVESCDMEIDLRWHADRSSRYCLIRQGRPLQCWSSTREGGYKDTMSVSRRIRYDLTDTNRGDAIQASATIEVLRISSKDRRQSRRSRHVWDLL